MDKENVITEKNFDVLLVWLDRNREAAARKYEKIRWRLIRIFTGRGCYEAEDLADETFDRVTRKMPQLAGYTGEPALYFYAVAEKVHLEWIRKQKKLNQLPPPHHAGKTEDDIEYDCLELCLENLPAADYRLIVEYYREEKTAKIENRRRLAESCGLSANALLIKVSRIRARLRECLQKCVAGKV